MNNYRKIFLFLFLSVSSQSLLAAWSLEPSYYLRAERNDNIYLTTQGNELAVTGGAFSPALRAIMEEENQSLVTDVSLQFTRYRDYEELNRDEGTAGLNWNRKTELVDYGISVNYTKHSSLDPSLDISGITDQKVDRKTAIISPNWGYQFAERWNFSVNLAYKDVTYDEPGFEGFENFKIANFMDSTELSASLILSNEISERDTLKLTYYQSAYAGEGNGMLFEGPVFIIGYQASESKLDYDYIVWKLGYEHQFDEARTLNLEAGVSDTAVQSQKRNYLYDTTATTQLAVDPWVLTESDESGQVYSLSFKQKNEISQIELSANRNKVAALTGGLDEIDTVKIYYFGHVTERLSWSMDVNRIYSRPDQDTNTQSIAESTRVNASPSLYYTLNHDWSISLGYSYSKRDLDTDVLSRESSMVMFTMSWREPKLLSTN